MGTHGYRGLSLSDIMGRVFSRRGQATLRALRNDQVIRQSYRSGADVSVRSRLDDFRVLFRDHGFRVLALDDPLCAASVGASLSAPFISITDLMGLPREIVLDAVVAMGTAEAKAALLALAVATDGQLETLAQRAAARMTGVPEPPWVRRARAPLRLLSTDRLRDRDDERVTGLIVAFGQGRYRACFVMRFHPDSLLTARILFMPETDRNMAVREAKAGEGPAAPYRFTLKLRFTDNQDSLVRLVGSMLRENELNLRMGQPPYPADLDHLARIGDVEIVPAVLVLLRKFILSAYGIKAWEDVDSSTPVWV